MPTVDTETLKREVKEIVQGADLDKLTSRLVRAKLQEKYSFDLKPQKKEIDCILMAEIDDQGLSHSEEDISDDEPNMSKRKKRSAEADVKGGPKSKGKKRPKGSEEDVSDEDWGKQARKKQQQVKKPAAAATGGGGRGRQSAFTKSFKLSEALADVVGTDVMARHEVVKRLWAVIKERELQDPKNKQFAICDDQLMKVFGIKRFRTFGMMKHLKDHFLEPA